MHAELPEREKDPAAHRAQSFHQSPAPVEKVPGPHSTHLSNALAPAMTPYVPAGHEVHASLLAPTSVPYVPGGHGVQSLLPVRVSKYPGLHGWQLVPPDRLLNIPAAHS